MAISIESHCSTTSPNRKIYFRIVQAVKVPPGSAFRKMDEQIQYFITHKGLDLISGERPDAFQVKHCEEWIKRFVRPRKSINYNISSYGLKHICEVWTFDGATWPDPRGYVTNGSFIEAALNLGYKYIPAGWGKNPNTYFNMSFRRDRKRHERIYGREIFLPWSDEETHVLEFSESHHARGLFPFHICTKNVSDRRGPGPGMWRVIATGTISEMFSTLRAKVIEMGVE